MNPALLFLVLSASPAELAVFPVVKTETGTLSADTVHARVETLAKRRAGIDVVSRSAFLTTSRDTIRALGDCALESQCLARVARAFTARYLVVVVVNTTVEPPLVATLLVDVDAQKLVHRSLEDGGQGLLARLDLQVDGALDAAGLDRLARLTVRTEPPDARVQVSRPARRDADGTLWVASGDVRLAVQRDGFEPEQRALSLTPGADQTVDIRLDRESSILASPWLWIGVAAVVAAGASAAFVVGENDRAVCACVGPTDCPPGC